VGDPDVSPAQLAQELHVVVPGDAERRTGLHHRHHRAQDAGGVRAAIHEVAQEDRLSAGGMAKHGAAPVARLRCVTQLSQQAGELRLAPVDVSDDVEGPLLVLQVVPERLPHDLGGFDLLR
jgi:hypothetical protein